MLIAPTNVCVILALTGFFALVFNRVKLGFWVLALGIFGIVLFGILPTGHNLTVFLERQARSQVNKTSDFDGIILLGGMFNNKLSGVNAHPEAIFSIDRVHAFQELSRQYPQATLYYTGGKGDLRQNDPSEADIIADYFTRVGFDKPVIYESQSRNTFENARFLRPMLQESGDNTRYLLITSAFHMARSQAIFIKAGYDVIPYAVDFQTDGNYRILPSSMNFSRNFSLSDLAVKEIVGHLAYWVTGKL